MKKLWEDAKDLINPQKSWSNYRTKIHGIDPPVVPFMGVYQTDLTFIEGKRQLNNSNIAKREIPINLLKEQSILRNAGC